MAMKKIAAFSLLISALSALSQSKAQEGKIYGKVKADGSLIAGATVTLRSSPDSVLVKGTAANDSGIYELNNLDTGNYILNITYLGISWNVNETDFARKVRRRMATRYISIGLTYNFSGGKKQTNRENVEAAGSDARGRL